MTMIMTRTMRSLRVRRAVAALAVPATVLALSIVTTAAAAPAGAATACRQQKTRTMTLRAVLNEYEYVTYITGSGQVNTTKPYYARKNVDLGRETINIVACQRQNGSWAALSYVVSPLHRDLDLLVSGSTVSPRPHTGERGFGVFVWRTGTTSIDISSAVCAKKPTTLTWLGAARGLTSLPIPLPGWASVGQYLLNGALPQAEDAFQCGELQKEAVPWQFDMIGDPHLVFPSTGHYVHSRRATWETSCGPASHRYCGVTHEETVEILPV